ncbi:MAG: ATP-binding protein [Terriglobales bacterium]
MSVLSMTEREIAALIVVAVSLLFFQAFRERYLLAWGGGWMAYAAFLFLTRAGGIHPASSSITAFGETNFVLAIALLAAAAMMSAQSWRAMTGLIAVSWAVLICAALRALYFPQSGPAQLVLEAGCALIAARAGYELVCSRLGGIGFGTVLFSAGLIALNLNLLPVRYRIPDEASLLVEILLGSSMLLVALDDSRARTRRLAILNELSAAIARSSSHAPMMQVALEKLHGAIGSKAAWFRLIEADSIAPTQHIGLSGEFLRALDHAGLGATLSEILEAKRAAVVKTRQAPSPVRDQFVKSGIHQIIVVPVLGKTSVIGTLSFACSPWRRHNREELEFLEIAAQKMGIAAENLRLLEQVIRSQRQWMNTFDSIQDSILAHDTENRVLKMNRSLLLRLEKAPADVLGNLCESVLPRKYAWQGCPYCDRGSGLTEGLDPCFGGQSVVSTSSYTEQGGQQKGTIHVVHDTTDRQVAEEKYRTLFEQVQEGVFVATLEGDLLDCNDAFVTMLGYGSRDELMALDLASVLGANVQERDRFRHELDAHNYVRNFEMVVRRKDGTLLTVAQSSFATRDATGRIERYQGFVLDITEKKRSEDEMRRRNRELNALNALAVIATQSFDLDEILNLTLRQVVSLFGADTGSVYLAGESEGIYRRRASWGPRSEARGRMGEVTFPEGLGDLVMRSRAEVVGPDFLPHLPPAVVEFACADRLPYWIWVILWSKDKPVGIMGVASREDRHYSSNDENLLVAISRQLATTIEKVQLYEETCRAYEDLRRTQEQLLQSEKMSAVGQLISGVAHELNNPLTAILGYGQLLESMDLSERAADYVGKLFKQAQRTQRVVQNLLSFARQRKPERQNVDLRRVLDETLALREYDMRVNNIVLERDISADLPTVVGDPHQLEQVFLNIINNAMDAMIEGAGKRVLKINIAKKDDFVCVEFADTGPGIKGINRIFDPFYTTKSIGKGTGLGLSICYGIVKEHNGEIVARNREEGGAALEVRLPASEKAPVAETATTVRRESVLAGRILLVEDEEAVLEFEREVLMGAGAEVTTAISFDELKERLRKNEFGVIVMNGRMPGSASVQELYRSIAAERSGMEQKLLLTFASVTDAETREFLHSHNISSLAKPFEVADLIAQVRNVIQKNGKTAPAGEEAKTLSAGAGG